MKLPILDHKKVLSKGNFNDSCWGTTNILCFRY